jgi:hypothetical protein
LAIQARKYLEVKRQNRLASWQTRILCQFIAATIDTQGEANPVLDAAGEIAFDAMELKEMTMVREEIDNRPAEDKNALGSYEKFMSTVARKQRG